MLDKRIYWIDYVKTIGIYLVIIGHTVLPLDQLYIRDFIYSFHIPLFFILSGLLFKTEKNSICFSKSIKAIIIPYFLLNLLVFFIFFFPKYIFYGNSSAIITPLLATLNGTAPMAAATCWFLLVLFWIRSLANFILQQKSIWILISCILLPLIGYSLYHFLKIELYYFIDQALIAYPFFIIGYFIKKYKVLETIKPIHLLFVFIGFILQAFLVNYIGFVDLFFCKIGPNVIVYYLASVLGSFIVIIPCILFLNKPSKFVQIISTGTIFILATHQQFYNYTNKYFKIFFSDYYQQSIFFSMMFALVFLVASYLILPFLINKCPYMLGGRKLK